MASNYQPSDGEPVNRKSSYETKQRITLVSSKEFSALEDARDQFLEAPEPDRRKRGVQPKEVLTFIGFVVILLIFMYLVAFGYIQDAAVAAAELGPVGHVIFIVLYIFVAQPFGWGFSVVIIAGGFSFGWLGVISAEIGTLVGSVSAYMLSKKVLSDWVRLKLKGMKPKTQAVLLSIELAIRQGKGGLGMQTGLRVNPVLPFGWTNAVMGIWEVAPLPFIASTMIGCQMDIILKTNLGVIAKTVGDLSKQTPETKKLVQTQLYIQCGVFFVVLVAGCSYSRWIMKNVMPSDEPDKVPGGKRKSGFADDSELLEVEEKSGETTLSDIHMQLYGSGETANRMGWRHFVTTLFRMRGNVMIRVVPVSLLGAFISFVLVALRTANPDMEALPELNHPFVVQIFGIILSFVIVARTNVALKRYFNGMDAVHTMGARWIDAFTSLLGFLRCSYDLHPDSSPKKDACVAIGLAMLHWTTLAHALAINALQTTQMGLDESIWAQRISVLRPPQRAALSMSGDEQIKAGGFETNKASRGVHMKDAMTADRRVSIAPDGLMLEKKAKTKKRELVKLGVYGDPTDEEIVRLHDATDKTAIVLMWMEEAISRGQVQGILLIAPPILGRVYGEIGAGLMGFNAAYRTALVPFPFCFSQLIAWCLVVFIVLCPIVAFVFTGGEVLTSTLTFACMMGFWGLNRIAVELENPFGCEVNHLPMAELHHAYIEAIAEMHDHPMPEYTWTTEDGTELPTLKRNMVA